MNSNRFEQQAVAVSALSKKELINRIKNFRGPFKMDFTQEYLSKLSEDRLRHILMAAIIKTRPLINSHN